MVKFKFDIIGLLKIWFGLGLFMTFGGATLIMLGLLPLAGGLIAALTVLSAGALAPADVAILGAAGLLYLAIFVPIILYAAGLIDSGLKAVFSISFGIQKFVKKGVEKIPVIGKIFGMPLKE